MFCKQLTYFRVHRNDSWWFQSDNVCGMWYVMSRDVTERLTVFIAHLYGVNYTQNVRDVCVNLWRVVEWRWPCVCMCLCACVCVTLHKHEYEEAAVGCWHGSAGWQGSVYKCATMFIWCSVPKKYINKHAIEITIDFVGSQITAGNELQGSLLTLFLCLDCQSKGWLNYMFLQTRPTLN